MQANGPWHPCPFPNPPTRTRTLASTSPPPPSRGPVHGRFALARRLRDKPLKAFRGSDLMLRLAEANRERLATLDLHVRDAHKMVQEFAELYQSGEPYCCTAAACCTVYCMPCVYVCTATCAHGTGCSALWSCSSRIGQPVSQQGALSYWRTL